MSREDSEVITDGISLNLLEAFIAVVDNGSLGKAGNHLSLSAKTVSARIEKLEMWLRMSLIDTFPEVSFYDEAAEFAPKAQEVLDEIDDYRQASSGGAQHGKVDKNFDVELVDLETYLEVYTGRNHLSASKALGVGESTIGRRLNRLYAALNTNNLLKSEDPNDVEYASRLHKSASLIVSTMKSCRADGSYITRSTSPETPLASLLRLQRYLTGGIEDARRYIIWLNGQHERNDLLVQRRRNATGIIEVFQLALDKLDSELAGRVDYDKYVASTKAMLEGIKRDDEHLELLLRRRRDGDRPA